MSRLDFQAINQAAMSQLPSLLESWLPGGKRSGSEYVALNPRRIDHNPGSFRINMRTGRWADFALSDAKGGDPVSLLAYLTSTSQGSAASRLSTMHGMGRPQ